MNTQVKQANYNQDMIDAIVAEYTTTVSNTGDNNTEILKNLSQKYGKSIHSLRAKLAQLKVYVKATTSEGECKAKGQKKEQLLEELELLAGEELASLCSATKRDLQTLIDIVKFCKR